MTQNQGNPLFLGLQVIVINKDGFPKRKLKAFIAELKVLCTPRIVCKLTVESLRNEITTLTNDRFNEMVTNKASTIKRTSRTLFETPQLKNNSTQNTTRKVKKLQKQKNSRENFWSETLFEEDVHKKIQQLEQRISYTKILVDQQLVLINYTAFLYNNSFDTIQDKISNLEKQFERMSVNDSINEYSQEKFDDLANYMNFTLNMIGKIINFAKSAITNPSTSYLLQVIPLHKIAEDVHILNSYLPAHQKVPIEDEDDINLLKILSHEISFIDGNLVISVKIPIINTESKQLFKLTPIPIRLDGLFFMVYPSTEYALIHSKSAGYTPITQEEFNECIPQPNLFICPTSYPTYYEKECEIRNIPLKNYITPLTSSNSFFLSVFKPFNITIQCPGMNETHSE